MPTFTAHVEFKMDAESLEDGGNRLRELAQVTSGVRFELKRGRIEPASADENDDSQGWASYGPIT